MRIAARRQSNGIRRRDLCPASPRTLNDLYVSRPSMCCPIIIATGREVTSEQHLTLTWQSEGLIDIIVAICNVQVMSLAASRHARSVTLRARQISVAPIGFDRDNIRILAAADYPG